MRSSKTCQYIYEPKSAKVTPSTQFMDAVSSPTTSVTQKVITRVASQHILTFEGTTRHRRSSAYSQFGVRKSDRIWKAVKQKRTIRIISLFNAVLSWLVTMLAYFVISTSNQEESDRADKVKVIIAVLSLLQASLVALKWRYNEDYMTIVRSALKLGTGTVMGQPAAVFEMHVRQQSLRRCLCECVLHMVVFVPYFNLRVVVDFYGINSNYSLDEAIFIIIAMRNYHTLQLLFWYSKLSEVRTHLLARVVGAQVSRGFIFRCYLAGHPLRLVVTVMCIIVFVPGLIEYTFANVSFLKDYYTIWSEYWIISMTQAPVGYGDSSTNTLFGEFSLFISCFTGISLLGLSTAITKNNLDLNLTECNLYSELLYTRSKKKHKEQATRMIQKWWRLMHMRRRRMCHPFVIIEFYTYLREYRSVITKCQKMKDNRFERQIESIEDSSHKQFRPLNEYLSPIHHAHGFVLLIQVQDLLRSQYQINTIAWQVYNLARRNWKLMNRGNFKHSQAGSRSPRKGRAKKTRANRVMFSSGQHVFAKARQLAAQNAKGRLLRGVTFAYMA